MTRPHSFPVRARTILNSRKARHSAVPWPWKLSSHERCSPPSTGTGAEATASGTAP